MPRKKDIVDLPMITAKEAAAIFGCGIIKFKLKFAEVLHEEIAAATARNGNVYLLTDVLKSAFPEASDHTIHMMALEFNFRSAEERIAKDQRRRAASERGKDEET